jgi:uncharacterized membrane protein YccC
MAPLPQKIAFAIANSAAILVALYIAFAMNLERPYWAMFTVFIIAKPISGAVRSKGLYRLGGTLAGAAMALLLVPPLVQAPVLLCLAICAWVGLCLYVSLFDRSPRSYAFFLAGYSAAIIGFSVVDAPPQIFDTVVSRVEEISIGIVCGTVAHSVFFPQNVTALLAEQVESALKICTDWIADAFDRPGKRDAAAIATGLSSIVTNLHGLYAHVAFETSDVPRRAPVLIALLDRIALLAPHLSAIQMALAKLREAGAVSPALASLLEKAVAWARVPEDGDHDLRIALASMRGETGSPRVLLEAVVVDTIRKLADTMAQARAYAVAMTDADRSTSPALAGPVSVARARPLHRDPGLALLSAASAAVATLLTCTLWIGLSWPEGGVAAQFAAIGCSLFATLDNPAEVIWKAVLAILIALPVAALYEFAILPQATGFESLALALLPILLALSFMQTFEKLEGAALVLAIAFAGALVLQENYRADFAVFVNSNLAEIAGLLIAIVANRVFRAIDPAWNALRISRAGWRAVSALARAGSVDVERWTVRMFDRLGLVSARLALLPPRERDPDIDGLRDMRVGVHLVALREAESGLAAHAALQWVRETVAEVYEARALDARSPDGRAIEEALDNGVAVLSAKPPSETRTLGLTALTGLRLDLTRHTPALEASAT